jgi:phosphatidylglycerophosphatase A
MAQGLGVGRIPVAPGTFGSFLGLLWTAVLLWPGHWSVYLAGTNLGIFAAVWLSGRAERLLDLTDPGSVVVDEIVAIPICFAGWLVLNSGRDHALPEPRSLFAHGNMWWTVGIFLAFRFFDVVKPWPVRQSQALPGGWGVTVDDVLAAVYVNVAVFIAFLALPHASQ